MTFSIGDDDRAARLQAEKNLADMTDRYHALLIKSTIDAAVLAAPGAGKPLVITPLLTPKASVGDDGKVTILGDGGEPMTPAKAVAQMAQSQEFGYLFDQPQADEPIDMSNLDSDSYRKNRGQFMPGGRFSKGRS